VQKGVIENTPLNPLLVEAQVVGGIACE